MGKPDVALKQWLRNKLRFADLFNGIIFDGEQIINPDELIEVNSESNIILNDKNNKDHLQQRWRDLTMQWHGTSLVLLAVENQQNVNYAMPVRSMLYDSLAYSNQIKLLWNKKSDEEKKTLNNDEFLSHFCKDEHLSPVFTIVFYFGDKTNWDAPLNLHDMFDVNMYDTKLKTALKKFVPNYHINLLDVSNIPDISVFKSDLHLILGMLEYKKDTEKLREYTISHRDFFERMDCDTREATKVLLNSNNVFKKLLDYNTTAGGEVNMCEALEGLQKLGEEIGEKRGETITILSKIKAKVIKNKPLIVIADELEDIIDNLKPLYDAVLACGTDKDIEEIYQYYIQFNKKNIQE